MIKRRKRFLRFLPMILFFWGAAVEAQDTGVSGTNLELYRPAIDSFGYFGVNRPEMYRAGQFYLGLSQGFAANHLFRATINYQDMDVVDRIATTNFLAALGVNDFLTVALDIPVHLYMKGTNIDRENEFTSRSLGDIRAGLKFRLLKEKKGGLRPGLAFLFTNTFPTGNERNFLGTSHMVPAAELIVGKELKWIGLALNVGGRFPSQKNILGRDFNDQVTYGVGFKVPLGFWDRFLSLVGEVRGHFEPGDIQTVSSPIEFTLGFLKEFRNGLSIRAGGGGGWNNAIGNPRVRGILAISYHGSFKKPSPSAIQEAEIERLLELKKKLADKLEKERGEQRVRELQEEVETLERESRQREELQEKPEVVQEEVKTEKEVMEGEKVQELESQVLLLEQRQREMKRHLADVERQRELEKNLAIQAEREREEKEREQREAREDDLEVVKEKKIKEEEERELERKLAVQAEKEMQEQRVRELQEEIEALERESRQREKLPERPEVVKEEKVEGKGFWALWLPGFDLSPRGRSLWTTVYFSSGVSRPQRESQKWVDELAQAIRQNSGIEKVIIQGHADRTGVEEANSRLSLARAKGVKEMLLSRGVSEKLVQLEAHASKHPVARNDTKQGRFLNRRAEVIVIKGLADDN